MFESKINRGKANGYAPLGNSGKVPLDYLPPIQSTLNTGSFATTGSNTFTGAQTISGLSGTDGYASLNIGQTQLFTPDAYDIRASGSYGATISLTSDAYSIVGALADVNDYSGDASTFANTIYGFPYSDGPVAAITVQKSGSATSNWAFTYDGKSAFPGDVTIGFEQFGSGLITSGSLNISKGNINVTGSANITSGSLNVIKGNINVSGSVYVSSSLVVASSVVSNGSINALNSDLIIDGGDIVLSGSFAQQVNYAPLGSGSWDVQAIGEVTELDITKDIHLIDTTGNNGLYNWYLPDGLYDGQVVRFALKGDNDTNPSYVKIWMNNIRTYNGTIVSSTTWHPFYCGEGQGPCRSLGTAVFIDGAWNIDTDWCDM